MIKINMKIYKYTASLLVASLALVFSSCTDKYEEYNRSRTGATEEEMNRDEYLIRSYMLTLQENIIPVDANTNQFVECLLGGSYGGYLADSNDGFNNRNFATYIPEEAWKRVAFRDLLPKIMSNERYIKEKSDNPVLLHVATIIKVMGMHRITDIYGPIPYSQVGVDGKIQTPYDSQEEIYTLMFKQLDEAIDELTSRQTENFSSKADRIYKGNVLNWIKLANSLKLRLAMRIVNVDPTLAQTKAQEAVSHKIGIMSAISDNALLSLTTPNPFRTVIFDYNDGDSHISADIASFMNGYNDPRREKYFNESTFNLKSVKNGYLGIRSGISIPKTDDIKNYSKMNVTPTSKLMWMNAAEVAFLRAEGALRGWNMGGSAKELYNKGIELSFEQWGASGANQYMEDNTSVQEPYIDPLGFNSYSGTISSIKIKWDDSAGMETNLERIVTQKWIANFPLGIEAWSEYRRTGYPKLMKVVVNNSGGTVSTERMARRVAYPQQEYTDNRQNVNAAVSKYLNGPDNMGTDLWWAKKN